MLLHIPSKVPRVFLTMSSPYKNSQPTFYYTTCPQFGEKPMQISIKDPQESDCLYQVAYGFPPFNIYALLISLVISSHQPKLMRFHVQHVNHEKKNHSLSQMPKEKHPKKHANKTTTNAQLKSCMLG